MNQNLLDQQVAQSLQEDIGTGDISAALIESDKLISAQVTGREAAVVCGIPWVNRVYQQVDPTVQLNWLVQEGQSVEAKQIWFQLQGSARSLLTAERTALNWLQTLSGVATQVRKYLEKLTGTTTQLLDTRKTIPGLRAAQKYAVQCAGGRNHRMGLFDAFLIKENHLMSCGSITQAVQIARIQQPGKIIEVEVETLVQLREALSVRVDIIMLDNFQLPEIKEAVAINCGQAKLEVSGNITLDNIRQVAETGVDYISVGSLTKHLHAIDLSMRFFAI
ncbi:MAG: carboxylating nicotinate-nucleotide diphosphorylase [Proteobacteria bacterium]|nr:carboxylating nicotinate-nucleotide diphosphorylase [Pseudomonadota bacterium]